MYVAFNLLEHKMGAKDGSKIAKTTDLQKYTAALMLQMIRYPK